MSGAADVAALDPASIGYIQLSDAPRVPAMPSYHEEAMFCRMPPGAGEPTLRDILAVLPSDLPVGLEIPMRAAVATGAGPEARLRPCVEAARALPAG